MNISIILCNLIGGWVENGEYPDDEKSLKKIVEGISYNNAVRYFGFDLLKTAASVNGTYIRRIKKMNENCAYCMEGELVNLFGIKIGGIRKFQNSIYSANKATKDE